MINYYTHVPVSQLPVVPHFSSNSCFPSSSSASTANNNLLKSPEDRNRMTPHFNMRRSHQGLKRGNVLLLVASCLFLLMGISSCGSISVMPPSYALNCGPDQYKCADETRCIPKSWKCDDDRDCQDGSDELSCGKCCYHMPLLFHPYSSLISFFIVHDKPLFS